MVAGNRSLKTLRSRFDEIYDACIVGGGFSESDEYYILEKERYWRSLELICLLNIPAPANILEIGGGQLAVLCKKLFNDHCMVADISNDYITPLQKHGIEFKIFNLLDTQSNPFDRSFDLVVLLEVIEHIPRPPHVAIEGIKRLLVPNGILFLTTRNLFRLRNLIRMFMGIEFLDRFTVAEPGKGLGHQLEYSGKHMRWQFERAGMQVIMLKYDSLGRSGHSFKARFARTILAPLELRPIWRDGLVVAARKSS